MDQSMTSLVHLDLYNLTGAWIETLLFGINFLAYIICTDLLLSAHSRKGAHRLLLVAISILFGLSAAHMGLTLRQLLEAFVDTRLMGSSPNVYYHQPTLLEFVKTILYALNVIAQNCLLLWRMYVVWDENLKLCLLPLVLEMGHIATFFPTLVWYYETDVTFRDQGTFAWGISGFTLNLAFNIIVSSMIAYRLWSYCSPSTKRFPTTSLFIFMECGGLFTFATGVFFILWITGYRFDVVSPGFGCLAQLATFSPLFIISRVGMGVSTALSTKSILTAIGSLSIPQLRTQEIQVNVTRHEELHHENCFYDAQGKPVVVVGHPHAAV